MTRTTPVRMKEVFARGAWAIALACALGACERPASRVAAKDPAASPAAPREAAASSTRIDKPAAAARAPDIPPDAVLTGRIESAIRSDPGMAGADVSVNAEHGVVSLTGRVKSPEQVAIASAHAQREDGVMRVENDLALNTP